VGATRRYALTPAQAYEQCSQPVVQDAAEAEAAAAALLPGAEALWPPLADWRVAAVRAGVRALPTRGADGSIPYAGRLSPVDANSTQGPDGQQQAPALPSCWVIGGLGARGLVYHAWLGRLVAQAVLARSEAGLPAELLRWQQPQ
jgi:glycine/D-amino acid oxidase-like deaminating enzyme